MLPRMLIMIGATAMAIVGVNLTSSVALADSLTAGGSISVGSETTALSHIAVSGLYKGTVVVSVSDVDLQPPCEAFDLLVVAEKSPVAGILFTIDIETLTFLEEGGMNSLQHPALESYEGFSMIKQGLSLERTDTGLAHGTLVDSITIDETTFDVDVKMSFPLEVSEPPLAPRKFKGADSKPARAFEKLVKAWLAGDLEGVKQLTASEFRSKVDQIEPAEAVEMMAGFADMLFPAAITITDTKIDGDHAVLTAQGLSEICQGVEESVGTIKLVREKRKWKIASVSFES
jgi:hypothetical protein